MKLGPAPLAADSLTERSNAVEKRGVASSGGSVACAALGCDGNECDRDSDGPVGIEGPGELAAPKLEACSCTVIGPRPGPRGSGPCGPIGATGVAVKVGSTALWSFPERDVKVIMDPVPSNFCGGRFGTLRVGGSSGLRFGTSDDGEKFPARIPAAASWSMSLAKSLGRICMPAPARGGFGCAFAAEGKLGGAGEAGVVPLRRLLPRPTASAGKYDPVGGAERAS